MDRRDLKGKVRVFLHIPTYMLPEGKRIPAREIEDVFREVLTIENFSLKNFLLESIPFDLPREEIEVKRRKLKKILSIIRKNFSCYYDDCADILPLLLSEGEQEGKLRTKVKKILEEGRIIPVFEAIASVL